MKDRGEGRMRHLLWEWDEELKKLHLVNVIVMIKIEKRYKLFLFNYFVNEDKRSGYVNTTLVL